MRRARAVTAESAAVRSRAAAAVAGAVALVSATALRHSGRRWSRWAAPRAPEPDAISAVFAADDVGILRQVVKLVARRAGLVERAMPGFVLAVQELMANAVRHGGGWGRLRLHREGDLLVCRVTDHGSGFAGDPARAGQLLPVDSPDGRGLFLARSMTDSLQIRTGPAGVTIKATMHLPARESHFPRESG